MTPGAGGAAHPAIAQAVPFLEALLAKANPSYFLEIRVISPRGRVHQYYHPIRDLFANGMVSALPFPWDGEANVYYGVCPRIRPAGKADAVGQAVAVWFDEITIPPPELPPFSWLVETSVGKVQGGYFLKEATSENGYSPDPRHGLAPTAFSAPSNQGLTPGGRGIAGQLKRPVTR